MEEAGKKDTKPNIDHSGRYWAVAGHVSNLLDNPTPENLAKVVASANDLAHRPDLVEIILRHGDNAAKNTLSSLPVLINLFNFKKIKIAQEKVEKLLDEKQDIPAELIAEFIQTGLPYRTDCIYLYNQLSQKAETEKAQLPKTEWKEIQQKNDRIRARIQKIFADHPREILKAIFKPYAVESEHEQNFKNDPAKLLADFIEEAVGRDKTLAISAIDNNLAEIQKWAKNNGYLDNLANLIQDGFINIPGLIPFAPVKTALEKILNKKQLRNELEKWKIIETKAENERLEKQKSTLLNYHQYHQQKPRPVQFSEAALVATADRGRGQNPASEDFHTHDFIEGFCELTPEQQKAAIEATYASEQERVAQLAEAQNVGCTAITTLAWTETRADGKKVVKTVAANLADSSAYVFIRNKNTGVINKYERLNKSLQNFADSAERDRVEALGESVHISKSGTARVGDIAVARGFGDRNPKHDKFMGRIPDIHFNQFTLESDEELIFITSCDGLTEESSRVRFTDVDAVYLANKLHKYNAIDPADKISLAEFLADEARKDSSTDDVTVMTQVYDQNTEDNKAELFCIFDGHGGPEISQTVGENFVPTLNRRLSPPKSKSNFKENLLLAAKITGAVLLIPAIAAAAFFAAPFIIAKIGLTLAASAASVVLGLAVVGTIALAKSIVSSFSNKEAVVQKNRTTESSEAERLIDSQKHMRSLGRIQASSGQSQEMQNVADANSTANSNNISPIKKQPAENYVYEEILNCDAGRDFEKKLDAALRHCEDQPAKLKYIYMKDDLGHAFVLELDGNNSRHLYYQIDGAGHTPSLGNRCRSSSLDMRGEIFGKFETGPNRRSAKK